MDKKAMYNLTYGLYILTARDGEKDNGCVINTACQVTTEPNRWVSPIHDRMPLALRFEEVERWLGGSLSDIEPLADRSAFSLNAHPELNNPAAEPSQLSLF